MILKNKYKALLDNLFYQLFLLIKKLNPYKYLFTTLRLLVTISQYVKNHSEETTQMNTRNKIFTLLLSTLAICTILSCGGKKVIEQSIPPPGTQYIIGPEDILGINVWKEPELSLSVPVRADGKISMPLIHDVHVVGLTPIELKEEITKRLSKYIENPTVSVIVEEINSLKIFIVGNVNQPGVFEIDREINVLQAISMAGGFTEWAKKSKIKIFRKHGGVEKVIKVNYNKIISGKHPELNIPLQPGDSIVVP
jgi:polysaccharide export outer membrane protein